MNTKTLKSADTYPTPTTRRTGLLLSVLAALFLAVDATCELLPIPPVIAGAAHIGFPTSAGFWQVVGGVLMASTLLYAVPRTAFIGAVLVTGYLGGAICAHVRTGEDVLEPTAINLLVATLVWAGLVLRDVRLRAIVSGR